METPMMSFSGVLTEAVHLASGEDLKRLQQLAQRARDLRLRVLVAGEAKRGKSTLVNALLGRTLLPTGVTPVTAVSTTVSPADAPDNEHVVVTLANGRRLRLPLNEVADYVTEQGNPNNIRGAQEVRVRVHVPLLTEHAVELVDTPGIGSIYEHNTAEARAALQTLDAAILVLSGDPPITASERDLLQQIDKTSVYTFVVLNKTDRLSADELEEAISFTRQVCREVTGTEARVFPCSARSGIADSGLARLRAELTAYLATHATRDSHYALHDHVYRTLQRMLDDARLRLRSHELLMEGRNRAVTELVAHLTWIAGTNPDIEDRCSGSLRRLRRELDQRAEQARIDVLRACREEFTSRWDELSEQPVDRLPSAVHKLQHAVITSNVDRWRDRTGSWLERELNVVAEHATRDLAAQLDLATHAVREHFDVALHSEAPHVNLHAGTGFSYDFSIPVGWAPPLQGAWVRLQPAPVRRARLREAARREVVLLCERQLGRARSQLQHRLEQVGKELTRDLASQLEQTVGHLRDVVSALGSGEPGAENGEALAARVDRLQDLLDRMGGSADSQATRA